MRFFDKCNIPRYSTIGNDEILRTSVSLDLSRRLIFAIVQNVKVGFLDFYLICATSTYNRKITLHFENLFKSYKEIFICYENGGMSNIFTVFFFHLSIFRENDILRMLCDKAVFFCYTQLI